MRKALLTFAVVLVATLFLNACRQEATPNASEVQSSNAKPQPTPTPTPSPMGEVSLDDFNKLAKFIETKGFAVKERGMESDHQYTFKDKSGNRHALIAIKRDKDGKPIPNGAVNQISVWAYGKGIRDQSHFVGYIISEKAGSVITFTDSQESPYFTSVRDGFSEFLAMVKASK